MTEIVAADIGGTHARFAIAKIEDGKVVTLSEPVILKCAQYASLQTAWEAYRAQSGRNIPRQGSFALATPIRGDLLKMTNNPWVIRPAALCESLGMEKVNLINDFGAIGHAVQQSNTNTLKHLCGPDNPMPENGVISIVGPGTGLGVAQLIRTSTDYHVIETEGGHIDFAPLDSVEDLILARMRKQYLRVSVERIVSGPGMRAIYETLAAIENRQISNMDDSTLWELALDRNDSLADAAFERFCLCLGAVTGDIALTQGARAVVIAGGLGQRIQKRLSDSGFADRFVAKGRYRKMMESIPVKLITHPQPGLLGAAAAFASRENS